LLQFCFAITNAPLEDTNAVTEDTNAASEDPKAKLHRVSENYVCTNVALFGRSLPLPQKKSSSKKQLISWYSATVIQEYIPQKT